MERMDFEEDALPCAVPLHDLHDKTYLQAAVLPVFVRHAGGHDLYPKVLAFFGCQARAPFPEKLSASNQAKP